MEQQTQHRKADKFVWLLSANHRWILCQADQLECSLFVALNLPAFLCTFPWVRLFIYNMCVIGHHCMISTSLVPSLSPNLLILLRLLPIDLSSSVIVLALLHLQWTGGRSILLSSSNLWSTTNHSTKAWTKVFKLFGVCWDNFCSWCTRVV